MLLPNWAVTLGVLNLYELVLSSSIIGVDELIAHLEGIAETSCQTTRIKKMVTYFTTRKQYFWRLVLTWNPEAGLARSVLFLTAIK